LLVPTVVRKIVERALCTMKPALYFFCSRKNARQCNLMTSRIFHAIDRIFREISNALQQKSPVFLSCDHQRAVHTRHLGQAFDSGRSIRHAGRLQFDVKGSLAAGRCLCTIYRAVVINEPGHFLHPRCSRFGISYNVYICVCARACARVCV